MGREIDVGVYDRLNNSYTLDFDDWFICGRDKFTNDLYTLFLNESVEFLILDIYNEGLEKTKVEKCKDIGNTHLDDSDAMFIDVNKFNSIIEEHIKKIVKEREEVQSRINSLEVVRNNTKTLQDWLDIDKFLKELKDDFDDRLTRSNPEEFKNIIQEAIDECTNKDGNIIETISIPLFMRDNLKRNNSKVLHRYYPIVLFSD